ncbi:MAG: ATP-dependent Clp protease ATP-binding subunit [Tissierellaceae bacterium]|jgi:ATP-dependent Clp protease ATP-binding subunit ClpC|nr:ATP-dependent Clp protease ATP-binding subunit [Tissierellaceae bacterium]
MAMFGRFTESAQKVMLLAQQEAQKLRHNYVGTEHLLLGLLEEDEGIAAQSLKNAGLNVDILREQIVKAVGYGSYETDILGFTPRTKRVFELGFLEARNLGNNYIGTEHILLGLLEEGEGVAVVVLRSLGVDVEKLREDVIEMLTENNMKASQGDGRSKSSTPNLDKYSSDLNKLAKDGKIDPVIGRTKEIERVIQVLSRRTKNNPCLIGEPGVGKTAIAEGLAQKIIEGKIPDMIKDKRVVSLDLASMIAGAKYRGEFEERFKAVMKELKESKDVILFIDELHTIVGAGAAEGAIDASNILKPVLARGELQIIGATTTDEYRKHIEKDSALERRFQPIMVEEPTIEDTIKILEGLRDRYEAYHRVKITDQGIKAAVELSARYITDRFLPDKAIDLMDEAASMVRLKSITTPNGLKSLEDKLEELSQEKEEAINNQNYEKAAKVRDMERKIKAEMEFKKSQWDKEKKDSNIEVGYDEIAAVVSNWTGIPVNKMTMEESQRLLNLEKVLHEKVVGQDKAVEAVSRAVRRARVGLKDPKKPIGTFIFVGPTGVGKTYLAKALAEALFGDEDAMIRVDMSEYMEKYSVSKLIGSPPGYVGYDEGGQLTEMVRRRPYSVILFDEIEKAHPDVFNVLLQILDDGRLTDSKGRTVDFKNTVIIMTSNVGATLLKKQNVLGFTRQSSEEKEEYEKMKETIQAELRRTFRPEFLNRIDDIIIFHSLNETQVKEIVDIMIKNLQKRLKKMDINVKISDETRSFISKKGFDPEFGARPLERVIRSMIEDQLAEEILKGNVSKTDNILINYDGDKLVFNKEPVLNR